VSQREIAKKITKTYFLDFKVIDVDTHRKFISSACFDKQQVYVYLQPFSR